MYDPSAHRFSGATAGTQGLGSWETAARAMRYMMMCHVGRNLWRGRPMSRRISSKHRALWSPSPARHRPLGHHHGPE